MDSAGLNKSFKVQRVIGDGDLIAVHSRLERVDAGKVYAVVHILRFSGEWIVELWDIAQEAPAESPNALGCSRRIDVEYLVLPELRLRRMLPKPREAANPGPSMSVRCGRQMTHLLGYHPVGKTTTGGDSQ